MNDRMNNFAPRKKSSFARWGIVVLLVLLLLALSALARPALESVFLRALAPVFALRNAFVASEAVLLRAQVAELEAKAADRDLLYKENLDLKARLGRTAPDGAVRILAAVLLRPPAIPYDTLLIDAGKEHGITEGSLVYAGGSLLIGRVSQVGSGEARVTLFSAPGEKNDALLLSAAAPISGAPIPLVGQGGGSFIAEMPANANVAAGDYVELPGVEGSLLARVSRVERREEEPLLSVYARLPVNPFELRYVEIRK